ncbi:MAG: hypothetical protein ACTSSK_03575 [Candidatus Heimdallarchaeota archaeon]
MKFKLTISQTNFNKKEMEEFKELGLEFRKMKNLGRVFYYNGYSEGESEIEINTLEELMEFIKEWGQVIIDEKGIEIYNTYRE